MQYPAPDFHLLCVDARAETCGDLMCEGCIRVHISYVGCFVWRKWILPGNSAQRQDNLFLFLQSKKPPADL